MTEKIIKMHRQCHIKYNRWHFYTADGRDVRFSISYDEQSVAKTNLVLATTAYFKWQQYRKNFGENNSHTQNQYNDYKNYLIYSIIHLGYSLHPVQDAYAHIREVCFQIPGTTKWMHLTKNTDNASLHTYAVLGPTASETLRILLTFYNSFYILRLNNSGI